MTPTPAPSSNWPSLITINKACSPVPGTGEETCSLKIRAEGDT